MTRYVVLITVVDYPSRIRHVEIADKMFSTKLKAEKYAEQLCINLCRELNEGKTNETGDFCEDSSSAPFRWSNEREEFDYSVSFWDGDDYELVSGYEICELEDE